MSKTKFGKFNESGNMLPFYLASIFFAVDLITKVCSLIIVFPFGIHNQKHRLLLKDSFKDRKMLIIASFFSFWRITSLLYHDSPLFLLNSHRILPTWKLGNTCLSNVVCWNLQVFNSLKLDYVNIIFVFLVRTITKDLQIVGIIPTNWNDIYAQILLHSSNRILDSLLPRIVFHKNTTWRFGRENHHVLLVLGVHWVSLRYEVFFFYCC